MHPVCQKLENSYLTVGTDPRRTIRIYPFSSPLEPARVKRENSRGFLLKLPGSCYLTVISDDGERLSIPRDRHTPSPWKGLLAPVNPGQSALARYGGSLVSKRQNSVPEGLPLSFVSKTRDRVRQIENLDPSKNCRRCSDVSGVNCKKSQFMPLLV